MSQDRLTDEEVRELVMRFRPYLGVTTARLADLLANTDDTEETDDVHGPA